MKKEIKKTIFYLTVFLVPIIIMLIAYAIRGIFPFGQASLLTNDMNSQYVSYLTYFKTNFFSPDNFIFSFTKSLGGGLFGLTAYYLLSPLNLILLFFSNSHIIFGIEVITIIKLGITAVTMAIFLGRKKEIKYSMIIFSTAYALIAYNVVYQSNIMWLDGVALLPLVLLGIDKIIEENKVAMYMITLGITIITNYYIGFMVCIFSVIYFSYKYLILIDKISFKNVKDNFNKILMFGISSVLVVGLTAVLLIPVFYDLKGGKASVDLHQLMSFKQNCSVFDVMAKTYTSNGQREDFGGELPNIFCGIITMFLVIIYFCDKKINKKEKLLSAGVIAILIISFCTYNINLIWHGLNPPAGFPFRYSFILSAFAIMLAYRGFTDAVNQDISKKSIIISFVLFILITISVSMFSSYDITYKYIDVLIILIVALLIYLQLIFKKTNTIIQIVIGSLMVFNLGMNTYVSIKNIEYYCGNDLVKFVEENQIIIDNIKKDDDSFYRIGKDYKYNNNDPMLLNYNGISHYSSSQKQNVTSFLKKIGYPQSYIRTYYNKGATLAIDSLLNIKYIVSKDDLSNRYEKISESKDVKVYKNKYSFPLGFVIDREALKIDMNKYNLFELQNEMFKSMASEKNDIFIKENIINQEISNVDVTKQEKNNKYRVVNKEQKGIIKYNFKVTSNNPVYLYAPEVDESGLKIANVIVNNSVISDNYLGAHNNGVIYLGTFEKNQDVTVIFEIIEDEITYQTPIIYYQDMNVFEKYYEKFSKQKYFIEQTNNTTYFRGNLNVVEDNKGLMLTIPNDKGLHVFVDGQEANVNEVFNCLMEIDLSKGEHKVEIMFIPRGIEVGIFISIVSILWTIIFVKYKKMKQLK